MSINETLQTAVHAVLSFLDSEKSLLDVDANERSLTHKLGEYLQRAFPDWTVDCEYNRLGMAIKRLPEPEQVLTNDEEGRTIFPDIIVHKRQTDENLLVIEVKKSTNKRGGDEQKLQGLTAPQGPYGYSAGLHLIVDCKKHKIERATAYRKGGIDEDATAFVQAAFVAGL